MRKKLITKDPHPLIEHLRLRANILKSFAANSAILESPYGKGITREFFVKEFLRDHLPQEIDIGRGEVISRTAKRGPGDLDIVLHPLYPPSPKGKGDKGGEVDKYLLCQKA